MIIAMYSELMFYILNKGSRKCFSCLRFQTVLANQESLQPEANGQQKSIKYITETVRKMKRNRQYFEIKFHRDAIFR